MSVAHRLIEKGVNIGIEKGIEKGVNIGIEKGVDQGRAMRDRELIQKLFAAGQELDAIAKFLDMEPSAVQRYLIAAATSG